MKTLLETQLATQATRGETTAAIFTDLDGTYVIEGNEAAAEVAAAVFEQASAADWPLIAVTGRSIARVTGEVQRGELPPFSAIVGAVGTEIVLRHGDEYIPETAYAASLETRYHREEVYRLVARALPGIPAAFGMRFQTHKPPERFKVSLHFRASSMAELAEAAEPLKRLFPTLKIIVSDTLKQIEPGQPRLYALDIVPASKSDAIRYLMHTYGIEGGIVAGDGGNDVDALLVPGLTAVLVNGHQLEAREAMLDAYPGAPIGVMHQASEKHMLIDAHPTRLGPESILLAMAQLKRRQATR